MNQKSIFSKLFVAALLGILATACNQLSPVTIKTHLPGLGDLPFGQLKPAIQTYTNSSYNFSFDYPEDFTFVTPTYGNLKEEIVQVQMGNKSYPKTNFDDAAVSVSTSFAKSQADCLKLPSTASAKDSFSNPQTINGVTFYSVKGSDAGAGNLYQSHIYRTYKNSNCLELNQTVHTSNINNYPAGTVTEVDQTQIQKELDQILQSFQFIN